MVAAPVPGVTCVEPDVPKGRNLALCGGLTALAGQLVVPPERCPEAPGGLSVGDGTTVGGVRLDCAGRYSLTVAEGAVNARLVDATPDACAKVRAPVWRPDLTGRTVFALAEQLPEEALPLVPAPLRRAEIVPQDRGLTLGKSGPTYTTGVFFWSGGVDLSVDGFALTLGDDRENEVPMAAMGGPDPSLTVGPGPIDVVAPSVLRTPTGAPLTLRSWGAIAADRDGMSLSLQRVRTPDALACGHVAVSAGTLVSFATAIQPEEAPTDAQLGCACYHVGTARPPTACPGDLGAPSEVRLGADWARVSWSASGCEELCR